MKNLGKLATILLLALNVLLGGMLIFSAYSPYTNPVEHPIRACMGLVFPVFLAINVFILVFWLIVRWKFALLSFLALAVCYSQIRTYIPVNFSTKNIPENSIKFLSFNVMAFGDLKKTGGKNPVLEYLQNSGADIICMQEYVVTANRKYVTQNNIDRILKDYPYKHIHAFGVACYSKFPILSVTPIDYRSMHNGSVAYELKIGQDTVLLVNNHLESNKLTMADKKVYEGMLSDPEAKKMKRGVIQLVKKLGEAQKIRSRQADAVAKVVGESKYPYVIVCGDFNDSPISYTHRVISEGLDDAFTTSGRGLGISYHQNKFYFRIDNILISKNMKAYNCTVDRSIGSSDHYPIWCYLSKR